VKLVTFTESDGRPRPGVLLGDKVVDLSDQAGGIRELIEGGPELLLSVQDYLRKAHSQVSLTQVPLLAPILNLPRLFGLGLAYRDRAIETHQAILKLHTIFLKLTSALKGPHSTVVLPKLIQQPDYEAEFAFVIGKGGKNIPADRWKEHVFGYTITNYVSAHDVRMSISQWSLGKRFDTFGPLGPAIVTKDEIPDPHSLNVKLALCKNLGNASFSGDFEILCGAMLRYLKSWIDQLRCQRLKPMEKLADTLLRHLEGILNYCRTKVRLGVVEAVNGNIKALLRRGRGYRKLNYLLLTAQRLAATRTELVTFQKAA
jgi:2-keto-4-pentenoate hydratase/2-oxohepta-3-ene-1,7-dioic acid hydratase in catechol pathway